MASMLKAYFTRQSKRRFLLLLGMWVNALLLWQMSNLLPVLFPLVIRFDLQGSRTQVRGDGRTAIVNLDFTPTRLVLVPSPAHLRLFADNGSDSANMLTWKASDWRGSSHNPYLRFESWLRGSSTYSHWVSLKVRLPDGHLQTSAANPPLGQRFPLPSRGRLTLTLERLEIPRTVELSGANGASLLLHIDPNNRALTLQERSLSRGERELYHWYFPQQFLPLFASWLADWLRMLAIALGGSGLVLGLSMLFPWQVRLPAPSSRSTLWVIGAGGALAGGGGVLFTWVLFDRAPHILDAVAYYFQARIFAQGSLTAPAPPVPQAFPTPFMIVWHGRWFSQYPPGTSLLLALGMLAHVPWLVEPLLAAGAVVLMGRITWSLDGGGAAMITVLLAALSPFLLLQSAAFLSHVPAMTAATLALFAYERWLRAYRTRWALVGGIALGAALLCREISAVIYGIVLAGAGLLALRSAQRQRIFSTISAALLGMLPLLCVYLLYDWIVTGVPLLLPRELFSPHDHLGFGKGIGFYGEHTLASGLLNSDEQLTSLAFTLDGWPFGISIAAMLLPFVLRRVRAWDWILAAIILGFFGVYIAYFYHGIALGPRYLFEAFPAMVLLASRGIVVLNHCCLGRERRVPADRTVAMAPAVIVAVAALLLCDLLYFIPQQFIVYKNYAGWPGRGGPTLGAGFAEDLSGRELALQNALLITTDWWTYVVYLAALNCPHLNCSTIAAFAPDQAALHALEAVYPQYPVFTTRVTGNTLEAVPLVAR